MTPEDKMSALFRAEAALARDFAFEARLAQQVARRRMWATILAMLPLTVAAAVLLWGLRPVLAGLGEGADPAGGVLPALSLTAAAGLGAALLVWGARRFARN